MELMILLKKSVKWKDVDELSLNAVDAIDKIFSKQSYIGLDEHSSVW
jgi:hypothetical protein